MKRLVVRCLQLGVNAAVSVAFRLPPGRLRDLALTWLGESYIRVRMRLGKSAH